MWLYFIIKLLKIKLILNCYRENRIQYQMSTFWVHPKDLSTKLLKGPLYKMSSTYKMTRQCKGPRGHQYKSGQSPHNLLRKDCWERILNLKSENLGSSSRNC